MVGFNQWGSTLLILAAGIFCALCVFSYLHSAVRLDFLHSLPVKRERLFAVKYLSGTLTFVLAFGCCQLLTLMIGAFYGVLSGKLALEILAASAMGLLYFLGSFSGTLLAVMLTGKILTSVCAVGVFGLYLPLVMLLKEGLQELFLGNLFEEFTSRIELLCYTSPWAFSLFHSEISASARKGLTGSWPTMAVVCQMIAMIAVLTAISLLLYRIRRTEAAGSALAFRKTEGIIKLMLTIPLSLLAAMIAFSIYESLVWEVVFILLFGALGCMIMEFIYRWDIRQVFTRKRHMILTFAVSAAIFFVFRFDMFGYNSYLPAKEEVQSMAVKDNYARFRYEQVQTEEHIWYNEVSKELLDYLETENFDVIYEIAENGIQDSSRDYYEDVSFVYVKFHLKNGDEVYRCYWVDTELYQDCMDQLMQDDAFREKYFPILGWEGTNGSYGVTAQVPRLWFAQDEEESFRDDADTQTEYAEEDIEYSDEYYTEDISYYPDDTVYLEIPADRVKELIEAYRTDLENVSFSSYFNGNAMLSFHYRDWMEDWYSFSADFTETMKVLQEIRDTEKTDVIRYN